MSHLKHLEIAGLLTSTTPSLLGESLTEAHISSITDSIILLRYVEIYGEMRRGLTVLKMRGFMHDKNIREFVIDRTGVPAGEVCCISGKAFRLARRSGSQAGTSSTYGKCPFNTRRTFPELRSSFQRSLA